jgi:hypothetical protein
VYLVVYDNETAFAAAFQDGRLVRRAEGVDVAGIVGELMLAVLYFGQPGVRVSGVGTRAGEAGDQGPAGMDAGGDYGGP